MNKKLKKICKKAYSAHEKLEDAVQREFTPKSKKKKEKAKKAKKNQSAVGEEDKTVKLELLETEREKKLFELQVVW
jgi:hypothetical protein